MSPLEVGMRTIGAAKFKEQCLSILDDLGPDGIVVTKRGRPVARVLPIGASPGQGLGALAGRLAILGDVLSTAVPWEAADGEP